MHVCLEIGRARTFAIAVDWPGWCRGGRGDALALQALCDYGPRYARAIRSTRLPFRAPAEPSAFTVVERLPGNATTDYGAPEVAWPSDTRQVDEAELRRFQLLLKAIWRTFDAAARAATGQALRKGPRGGGRDLAGIIQHVRDADAGYLTRLGGKLKAAGEGDPAQALELTRQAILDTLIASAHGKVPARGPRGGFRWTARYFVRRLAWHELDHAWEIEDRLERSSSARARA